MSVYFPQVVIPTLPPQTTLDVTLTVQGGPPTDAVASLRDASWQLQAVFTENTRIQKFPFDILQGEFFLIGQKYTEPKAAAARLVTLTGEDQTFYMDIDEGQRPRPGHGYLAGDHPEGITRVEGEPSPATIRVHYRAESGTPGDGVLVAEVQSNADGTWLVQGLDPDLKFDVICRYPGYNDMILSNVSPVLAAGLQFSGEFSTLESTVEILLGTGPYQVDVVDGALPLGVEIQVAGDVMSLVGQPENTGTFEFTLRVIDANGISGVLPGTVEGAAFDPHWDNVGALLHFDGDLSDETGREWTALGTVQALANEHAFGGVGAYFSGSGSGLEGVPLIPDTGDWTLELRFMSDPGYTDRHLIGQNTRSGAGAINRFVVEQSGENQITVGHNNGSQWRFLYINYTPSTEGFNSLMVSREGNRICGSVNGGEIVRTAEIDGLAFAQVPFTIGVYSVDVGKSFIGFIDEFRFTKGVARYTENFTPPTAPFPNRGL